MTPQSLTLQQRIRRLKALRYAARRIYSSASPAGRVALVALAATGGAGVVLRLTPWLAGSNVDGVYGCAVTLAMAAAYVVARMCAPHKSWEEKLFRQLTAYQPMDLEGYGELRNVVHTCDSRVAIQTAINRWLDHEQALVDAQARQCVKPTREQRARDAFANRA